MKRFKLLELWREPTSSFVSKAKPAYPNICRTHPFWCDASIFIILAANPSAIDRKHAFNTIQQNMTLPEVKRKSETGYTFGCVARSEDVASFATLEDKCVALSQLRPQDPCFVLHSDGQFTFARVVKHDRDALVAQMNAGGSKKSIPLQACAKYIRLLKTGQSTQRPSSRLREDVCSSLNFDAGDRRSSVRRLPKQDARISNQEWRHSLTSSLPHDVNAPRRLEIYPRRLSCATIVYFDSIFGAKLPRQDARANHPQDARDDYPQDAHPTRLQFPRRVSFGADLPRQDARLSRSTSSHNFSSGLSQQDLRAPHCRQDVSRQKGETNRDQQERVRNRQSPPPALGRRRMSNPDLYSSCPSRARRTSLCHRGSRRPPPTGRSSLENKLSHSFSSGLSRQDVRAPHCRQDVSRQKGETIRDQQERVRNRQSPPPALGRRRMSNPDLYSSCPSRARRTSLCHRGSRRPPPTGRSSLENKLSHSFSSGLSRQDVRAPHCRQDVSRQKGETIRDQQERVCNRQSTPPPPARGQRRMSNPDLYSSCSANAAAFGTPLDSRAEQDGTASVTEDHADLPRQGARLSKSKFLRSFSSGISRQDVCAPHYRQDVSRQKGKTIRDQRERVRNRQSTPPPPARGRRRMSNPDLYSSCSANAAALETPLDSRAEQDGTASVTEDHDQSTSTADDALSTLSLTSIDSSPGSVTDEGDSLQFSERSLLMAFRSIGKKRSEGYIAAPLEF